MNNTKVIYIKIFHTNYVHVTFYHLIYAIDLESLLYMSWY